MKYRIALRGDFFLEKVRDLPVKRKHFYGFVSQFINSCTFNFK